MDVIALSLAGLFLYLYLEIWTIRVCLRYGGWAVAAVLVIDHLLMWGTTVVAPAFFVWKLWFLWTAIRAEPLQGILWVPRLQLSHYRPRLRRPGWRPFAALFAIFLVSLLLTAVQEAGYLGVIAGLSFLGLLGLGAWWLASWSWNTFRRWTAPRRSFREPSPWVRGPFTW